MWRSRCCFCLNALGQISQVNGFSILLLSSFKVGFKGFLLSEFSSSNGGFKELRTFEVSSFDGDCGGLSILSSSLLKAKVILLREKKREQESVYLV